MLNQNYLNLLQRNEKIVSVYDVLFKKKKNTINIDLIMTNYRIILHQVEDKSDPSQQVYEDTNFYIQDIIEVQTKKNVEYANEQLYMANISDNEKNQVIRFKNEQQLEDFRKDFDIIKLCKNELALIKFKLLAENPELNDLYQNLVISNIITDKVFWKDREIIKEFNKINIACEQQLGKMAKSETTNFTTYQGKKVKKDLSEAEKHQLLKREQELYKKYQKDVIQNKQNQKNFWEDFLQQQKDHDTIITGGLNPIFIENGDVLQDVQLNLDIDLVRNFEDNDEVYTKFEQEQQKINENFNKQELDNSDENPQKKNVKIQNIIETFNLRSKRILQDELQDNHISFDYIKKLQLQNNDGLKQPQDEQYQENKYIPKQQQTQMEIEHQLKRSESKIDEIYNKKEQTEFIKQLNSLQINQASIKNEIMNSRERDSNVREIMMEISRHVINNIKDREQKFDSQNEEYKLFEKEIVLFNKQAGELLKFCHQSFRESKGGVKSIVNLLEQLLEDINNFKNQRSEFKKYFNYLDKIRLTIIFNIAQFNRGS